jgi:hypothetical protein
VRKVKEKVQEMASRRRDVANSPLTSIEKHMREMLMTEWQKNALNNIMDPAGQSTNEGSKLSKT